MNNRIVALDFDGVICDSIDECMLVAYTAYTGNATFPPDFDSFFRKHRHIVRPPREYFLIVDAYHRGTDPASVGALYERPGGRRSASAIARSLKESPPLQFESRFFETREKLRAADFQAWLKMHRAYPQFLEGWPALEKAATTYVVTTRDSESLKHLLHAFGVNIPPERCRAKAAKPKAILEIASAHHIAPSEIVFVDDHPEHLHDVAQTGATVIWAQWGYWPSVNGFRKISSIKELTDD